MVYFGNVFGCWIGKRKKINLVVRKEKAEAMGEKEWL
jgi:hypothetical protein